VARKKNQMSNVLKSNVRDENSKYLALGFALFTVKKICASVARKKNQMSNVLKSNVKLTIPYILNS